MKLLRAGVRKMVGHLCLFNGFTQAEKKHTKNKQQKIFSHILITGGYFITWSKATSEVSILSLLQKLDDRGTIFIDDCISKKWPSSTHQFKAKFCASNIHIRRNQLYIMARPNKVATMIQTCQRIPIRAFTLILFIFLVISDLALSLELELSDGHVQMSLYFLFSFSCFLG